MRCSFSSLGGRGNGNGVAESPRLGNVLCSSVQLTAEARGRHSWASVCNRPSLGRTMDDPGEDPDLEPVDEEILDIELLDGVDEDDNLEEENEDDTEEVFESPRKRPSILLSLTGCSRVALSPFSDLEVPQTRLDPPTPSSPLSRSPSQFLRYPQKTFCA